MSGLAFDFTVNIPVLISIGTGFFLFNRWLISISIQLNSMKRIGERLDEAEEKLEDHGQKLAALTALSDGYRREQFRQAARHRD